MTSERWKQIEAVFEQVLALPEAARADFFKRTCDGDEELRREVDSLLDSHARAGSFIDQRSQFFSGEMLDEPGAAVEAGQLIGPYRVIREIGRGGMGAVYLAERADEQYKKQVAIKLIKRGMDTDSVLRHFRNERQILASFDHPNIARLYDGGTTETGLPYFVMEYVEGLFINAYCEEHDLSVTERLKLFREVCAAVSYAHGHLVIHRDIKRSNILITAEGVPKLLDFGIAKILQEGDGAEPLATMTGLRLMTPEYASPEQVRGEPITTASDVYSLGVVLYELLTGQSPYRATSQSPNDVARAITDSEPLRPSTAVGSNRDQQLGPEVSNTRRISVSAIRNQKLLRGDLDNIVLMALRKEPRRRYQSVEQFSEDIRRHLEARPILARKDTVGYRTAKFVRRNSVATAAALLLLLSLLGGIIATTWQAQIAKAEKGRAERRFNDVRKLANTVLFDYHDAIKDLPGATKVRERLVKDALTYLDSLAGEAQGDPVLQRELAAAYERVGDVRGAIYGASLGDRAGATESYEKALRIREALVIAAPRDVQNRRELAASYKGVGYQLLGTSEEPRGLELIDKSLAVYSQLASQQPSNTQAKRDLGKIYSAMALALESRGDMAVVLENYRKAIPIFEELLAQNPQDRADRRSLSVAWENLGRALFLKDDLSGALQSNEKALELRKSLAATDPTNADYRRILAISYQNQGDYRAWMKDITGALESFRQKLALDEEAFAADPANAQARGDLGYCNLRMGDLLKDSGQHTQAVPHYQRAIQLYQAVAAADPKDLPLGLRLIILRAHFGETQAKLGNTVPAGEECAQAADLLQKVPDQPGNVEIGRLRMEACIALGDAYLVLAEVSPAPNSASENRRKACDVHRNGLAVMQELRSRGLLQANEITEMEELTRKIAECD